MTLDTNGHRTKITFLDGSSNLTGYEDCVFDEKTYKETVSRYGAVGTLTGSVINWYDVYGNIIVQEAYDPREQLLSTTRWAYRTSKITCDKLRGFPGRK